MGTASRRTSLVSMANSPWMSVVPANVSPASWLALQDASVQARFQNSLSDEDALALRYDWTFWARPKQLPPPGDWRVWMILAGRGWGKTRTGAEWVRDQVESGRCQRIAILTDT